MMGASLLGLIFTDDSGSNLGWHGRIIDLWYFAKIRHHSSVSCQKQCSLSVNSGDDFSFAGALRIGSCWDLFPLLKWFAH